MLWLVPNPARRSPGCGASCREAAAIPCFGDSVPWLIQAIRAYARGAKAGLLLGCCQELKLSYQDPETILSTVYPDCGILN